MLSAGLDVTSISTDTASPTLTRQAHTEQIPQVPAMTWLHGKSAHAT